MPLVSALFITPVQFTQPANGYRYSKLNHTRSRLSCYFSPQKEIPVLMCRNFKLKQRNEVPAVKNQYKANIPLPHYI
jgi:hypothetical protein